MLSVEIENVRRFREFLALFYDATKEIFSPGIDFDHSTQACWFKTSLFSMRNNANCFFDSERFVTLKSSSDHVRTSKPNRLLRSQVGCCKIAPRVRIKPCLSRISFEEI